MAMPDGHTAGCIDPTYNDASLLCR